MVILMFHHPHPFNHWKRHMAIVPKGFLRYYVLKLLDEKPMSGSEIMEEIERRSEGCWKPSPGSIYPLLAWLQDRGYIKELLTEESGVKRYKLTEQGETFLRQHLEARREMQKRLRFFTPPFSDFLWFEPHPKEVQKLRETARRLMTALWDLKINLRERFSKEIAVEAKSVLEQTVERIEKINKKFKE